MTEPSEFLPLREPTFFILLSLAGGAKHGYAILKDVESLSDGHAQLSTSTLYEALARLLDQGVVARAVVDDDQVDNHPGRSRKLYRLTQSGEGVLNAELARLQRLVNTAQRQLALLGSR